ncbi:MAG: hypothetical protein KME21_07315 [Desmonostoc vinosum HA7617-LM4]|jgi:hypothetical protein|nr:hypothetical protein [Desmonostoc vinosum HA7617-LM4]
MKTNWKIASFMVFFVGAYILVPKIGDCTGTSITLTANNYSAVGSNGINAGRVNSHDAKDIYIPPNYGGPDSQHGSGTR